MGPPGERSGPSLSRCLPLKRIPFTFRGSLYAGVGHCPPRLAPTESNRGNLARVDSAGAEKGKKDPFNDSSSLDQQ